MIDGSANLPDHFADTLKMLGFDPLAGDALPMDTFDYKTDPEVKARRVAAAAKTRRRERKGERRNRGGRDEAGKPAGKSTGKPAGRSTGKPAGRGAGKPAGRSTGKPPGRPRPPTGKPPAKG